MKTVSVWRTLVRSLLVTALLAAGAALAAGADGAGEDLAVLRQLKVTRQGKTFGLGDNVSFPGTRAVGIERAPRLRDGSHRLDGFLDIARSIDGQRLWTRRATDDGESATNVFQLHGARRGAAASAVLQFVDGYTEPAQAPGELLLGESSGRNAHGDWIESFFEAWVVLPEQQLIYRPTSGSVYPLVPARGKPSALEARRPQWMVFFRQCPETGSGCVFYGHYCDVWARWAALDKGEGDTWNHPYECKVED